MDIFEQIHKKITENEAERKMACQKLDSDVVDIHTELGNHLFKLDQREKEIHTIQDHQGFVLAELESIKSTHQTTSEDFIQKLSFTNHELLKEIEQLREKVSDMDYIVNVKTAKIASHENSLEELQKRMQFVETAVEKLGRSSISLETLKCDRSVYESQMAEVIETLKEHTAEMSEIQNNNQTLENYMEKYQPIRTQCLITDTLNSVLPNRERKRLENYDTEKMSLFYKNVLQDQGVSNIQKLIIQLNEKAKKDLEDDEKKKKRRQAISEVSKSIDGKSSVGAITSDLNIRRGPITKGSSNINDHEQNYQKPPQIKYVGDLSNGEGSDAVDSDDNSSMKDSDYEQQKKHKSSLFVNLNQQQATASMPIDAEFNYKLRELVAADFKLEEDDDDFDLTQEQLIKVMKMFLYKMNLLSKKNSFDKAEVEKLVMTKHRENERYTQSALEEVSQFLQTVHSDFESFLKKHKREHSDMTQKMGELVDICASSQEQQQQMQQTLEGYATILSCLTEFDSIENALALQDEQDRAQISLIGQKQVLKGDSLLNYQASQSLNATLGGGAPSFQQQQTSLYSTTSNFNGIRSRAAASNAFNQQYGSKQKSISITNTSDDNGYQTVRENATTAQLLQQQNAIVSLDSSCLSCSGQPSHIVQSFKLACLSYQPSRVSYRLETYQRDFLLKIRKTLLEKCEEIMSSMQRPFLTKNLTTKKIFSDLLQYFNSKSTDGQGVSSGQYSQQQQLLPTSFYLNKTMDSRNQSINYATQSFVNGEIKASAAASHHGRKRSSEQGENKQLFNLRRKANMSVVGVNQTNSKSSVTSSHEPSRNKNYLDKKTVDSMVNTNIIIQPQRNTQTISINTPAINLPKLNL